MGVSSKTLMEMGITFRQIDYWCKKGYLNPKNANMGPGTSRYFDDEEVAVAKHMHGLILAGFVVDVAHRVARKIVNEGITQMRLPNPDYVIVYLPKKKVSNDVQQEKGEDEGD